MSDARKVSQTAVVLQDAEAGAGLVTPRERPAWAMSLVVHVGGLLLLASLTHVTLSSQDFDPVDSVFREFDPDDYSFDTVVVEALGNQSDIDDPSPSQAAATTPSKTPQQEILERLDEIGKAQV